MRRGELRQQFLPELLLANVGHSFSGKSAHLQWVWSALWVRPTLKSHITPQVGYPWKGLVMLNMIMLSNVEALIEDRHELVKQN